MVTAALQEGQDVPFEQLEQMRQHGGITKQQIRQLVEKAKAKSFKRENKNRPMEMSSKRPVPRLRDVVEGTKRSEHALNLPGLMSLESCLGGPSHETVHGSSSAERIQH